MPPLPQVFVTQFLHICSNIATTLLSTLVGYSAAQSLNYLASDGVATDER
jgi:hypothetical protein